MSTSTTTITTKTGTRSSLARSLLGMLALHLAGLLLISLNACTLAEDLRDAATGEQEIAADFPFQKRNQAPNLLQAPLLRGGLVIRPAQGLRTDADAVAEALVARDIAATVSEEADGPLTLSAVADEGRLTWTLTRADEQVARFETETDEENLGPQVAARVERVIERLEAETGLDQEPSVGVHVLPVAGAPADGAQALAAAMRAAVNTYGRAEQIEAAPRTAEAKGWRIVARAETTPLEGGALGVEIVWALVDPEGRMVGQAGQRQRFPAGAFDDGWGADATDAALGAAPALLDLLKRALAIRARNGNAQE